MDSDLGKKFRAAVWPLLVVALAVSTTLVGLQGQLNEGRTIKSVHLFDLPTGVSRTQIEEALTGLNRAIAETGHTDANYVLWEVNQAQVPGYPSIGYHFVMEGIWPSQTAYDEIRETPAFRGAIEDYSEVLQAISDASVYSRYQRVGLGGQPPH